jgi:hypothetical protein
MLGLNSVTTLSIAFESATDTSLASMLSFLKKDTTNDAELKSPEVIPYESLILFEVIKRILKSILINMFFTP